MFRCEICGGEYKTISERAKCEMTCIKKQEIEAENKKKAELKAKKEIRLKEIKDKYNEITKLIESYNADYDTILGVGNIPQNNLIKVKPVTFNLVDFFDGLLENR